MPVRCTCILWISEYSHLTDGCQTVHREKHDDTRDDTPRHLRDTAMSPDRLQQDLDYVVAAVRAARHAA